MSDVQITGRPPNPREAQRVLDDEADRSLREAAKHARDTLERVAPKGPTRRLSSRISVRVARTPTGVRATVRPTAKHALYVERGTGLRGENQHAAVIRPKARRRGRGGRRRPALRFADGRFFAFSRGQRANRFVERARQQAESQAVTIMEAGAARAARRLEDA